MIVKYDHKDNALKYDDNKNYDRKNSSLKK